MFHIVNIVSHFKQSPFVTPPVGHSERSEESPLFMFLGGVGGGDFFPPPMIETLHFVQGDK